MDRRTIARSLKQSYGRGMVTISQVAEFIGIGRSTAATLLKDLDYLPMGKGNAKSYLVDDVAEMIMQRRG